jgi:hypothetical protein
VKSVRVLKTEERHSSAETRLATRKGSVCWVIDAQTVAEGYTSCTGCLQPAAAAVAAEQADKEK